jgi:hypothetical protein
MRQAPAHQFHMFDYNSKLEFQSSLYTDVSFTLRRMSEGRKAELRRALAKFNSAYRELQHQLIEIDQRRTPIKDKATGEIQVNKDTGEPLTEFTNPLDRIEYLNVLSDMDTLEANEAKPLYLKWAIESVHGMRIDGVENPTADLLIDSGPPDLTDEVLQEIKRLCGLTPSEQKNSASASISSAAEETPTTDTAADPVSETDTTASETAQSTSAAT